MSKLFKLKQWLTLEDAAKRLSTTLGEQVTVADILQLALDGRLKLSVNFVNHAYAKCCRRVPIEEATYREVPSIKNPAITVRLYKGPRTDSEVFEYEDGLAKLIGVYNLSMVGAERLDVNHRLQMETGGPVVTLINLDGPFVENGDGYIYQVREIHHDKKISAENSYPAGGLPDDAVLVIRTSDITRFETASNTEEEEPSKTNTTERENLLKMLGGMALLLAEKGGKYKRGNKPNASSIADEVSELIEHLPNSNLYGMSTRNIREKLSEAIRLLADS